MTGSTSVFQLRNATTYLDRFKEGKKEINHTSYYLFAVPTGINTVRNPLITVTEKLSKTTFMHRSRMENKKDLWKQLSVVLIRVNL